jgi:hypothetical protein
MTILLSAPVLADEPVELTAQQMDQITAGSLRLDNGTGGKIIFANFDNPAGDDTMFGHPALGKRSLTSHKPGQGPSVSGFRNDGPWVATVVSPVITCVGFEITPGGGPAGTGGGCLP